jgi:hypothetical protein
VGYFGFLLKIKDKDNKAKHDDRDHHDICNCFKQAEKQEVEEQQIKNNLYSSISL